MDFVRTGYDAARLQRCLRRFGPPNLGLSLQFTFTHSPQSSPAGGLVGAARGFAGGFADAVRVAAHASLTPLATAIACATAPRRRAIAPVLVVAATFLIVVTAVLGAAAIRV